ncbi:AhpC/TSA family protein [Halosquirtibacter laminarini]|uniref:AhpC/TSA family protein n=1 Tax=Halosquirtibacter laminarini TaxID=3374600 RepID=A0AC61NCX0_9BACT|nr:AhpC/TSA family protein [Prolixibacteraceae bacterium]
MKQKINQSLKHIYTMTMKRFLFFTLILATFVACQKESNLKIKGTILEGKGKKVYLYKLHTDGEEAIDSTKIDGDGAFEFGCDVSYPTFFLVKLSPSNFVTVVGDSLQTVEIDGSYKDLATDYSVKGSEASEEVRVLNLHMMDTQKEIKQLQKEYRNVLNGSKNIQELNRIEKSFQKVMKEQTDFSTKFVKEHPFSMASIIALYQKFDYNNYVVQDLQTMKTAASALAAIYPDSKHVKTLHQNTLRLINKERNVKMHNMLKQYAVNSPDIKLPNVKGKVVNLSSLRGKYVLVHFWASTDQGSRIQNEILKENYQIFHKKGFEIYQVSVDTNKSSWEKAIKQDRLTWINVGDMQGSNQAVVNYNVQMIPTNYLLDPKGNILAKNLIGPEVNKVLSKVLK